MTQVVYRPGFEIYKVASKAKRSAKWTKRHRYIAIAAKYKRGRSLKPEEKQRIAAFRERHGIVTRADSKVRLIRQQTNYKKKPATMPKLQFMEQDEE